MLENTKGTIRKGQSRETGNIDNMCWTPIYTNKYKQRK